ncbi:MAG: TetR/AcrR family transcriptional regulator [Chloroflexota bacterium]
MSNKKQRQYHHGDLYVALLEAATEMIAKEGLESLTLRALSQRVGVSRTAPYRHFADKSALLAAVAEEGFKRLLHRLQVVAEEEELDALSRFQQMGVAYILFAVDSPVHYRLMFSSETASPESYPDLAAVRIVVFNTLVTAIEQCQSEDKIESSDPRALATVAWSTVHGLSSLLIDQQIQNQPSTQEIATFTTQTLIDGLSLNPQR